MAVCDFLGCEKVVSARGYCAGHYYQFRYKRELKPLRINRGKGGTPTCGGPDCDRLGTSVGMCSGHRRQVKLGYPLTPIARYESGSKCEVVACDSAREKLTYCGTHYRQHQRGNTPGEIRPVAPRGSLVGVECSMDTCGQKSFAFTLCNKHYGTARFAGNLREFSDFAARRFPHDCSVNGCGRETAVLGSWCVFHKTKSQRLVNAFGIDLDTYYDMLDKQCGVCAICRAERVDGDRYFHVDHDHLTGAVRSILCSPCNTAIGLLGDSSERVDLAAVYLRQFGK